MAYKVFLLSIASSDIKESAKWYEKKQKGLGRRFATQIRLKIKFLRENPEAAPVRYDDVRTAVPEVFPFLIHYIIDNIDHSGRLAYEQRPGNVEYPVSKGLGCARSIFKLPHWLLYSKKRAP